MSKLSACLEELKAAIARQEAAAAETDTALGDGFNVHGAVGAQIAADDMLMHALRHATLALNEVHVLEPDSIQVTMFPVPSGNVSGIVAGFSKVAGKTKRIAHATVLTDKEPAVSLSLPAKVDLRDMGELIAVLTSFTDKTDQARTPNP